MIVTKKFNMFNFGGKKLEEKFEDIKDFITHGGDITLDIIEYDHTISFVNYFYKDVNLFKLLIDNNLIDHPLKLDIDIKNKKIFENKFFDLAKIKIEFNFFKNSFLTYWEQLLIDLKEKNVNLLDFKFSNKKWEDYNVLEIILFHLQDTKAFEILLKYYPEYKEEIPKMRFYFDDSKLIDLFSGNGNSNFLNDKQNSFENASIFKSFLIKNSLMNFDNINYSDNEIRDILYKSVENDNYDTLNILKEKMSFNFLNENFQFQLKNNLLFHAKNKEMANYLLNETDAWKWKEEDLSSQTEKFPNIFEFCNNIDIIEEIIKKHPENKIYFEQNILNFFSKQHNRQISDTLNIIQKIKNMNININHLDLLSLHYYSTTEDLTYVKNAVELGVNNSNNPDLIKLLIDKRDSKIFNALKKTKLVDFYSADNLSHFYSQSHNTATRNLIKTHLVDFHKINSKNFPIYFYTTLNLEEFKFKEFKNEIYNNMDYFLFKQNSSYKLIELNIPKNFYFSHSYENGNYLHKILSMDFPENQFRKIIENADLSNLTELLFQKDNKNNSLLDIISQRKKNPHNRIYFLNDLIKANKFNLDWNGLIDNKTIIDTINEFYHNNTNDSKILEEWDSFYKSFNLKDKISNKLIVKNPVNINKV